MIRNLFNTGIDAVANALASDTALSAGEVTALHDEIHNDSAARGYAGKSAAEILSLAAAATEPAGGCSTRSPATIRSTRNRTA